MSYGDKPIRTVQKAQIVDQHNLTCRVHLSAGTLTDFSAEDAAPSVKIISNE